MAWQRLRFPGLKIKPQFALFASFLLLHYVMQFQYKHLLIDCPVRKDPSTEEKTLSTELFYRSMEIFGEGRMALSPPTLTLVRLMIFLPLGRIAFV